MSFKPAVTAEGEEMQKTSIQNVQHEQAGYEVEDNESIEMVPVPVTSDSQGRVQLHCLVCRNSQFVQVNELRS